MDASSRWRRLRLLLLLMVPLVFAWFLRERYSWLPRRFELGGTVSKLAFSPDGAQLACVVNSRLVLLNLRNKQTAQTNTRFIGSVRALQFSPDGKTLVSAEGAPGGTIRLIDAKTGIQLKKLYSNWPSEGGSDIAFSPNGQYLLGVSCPGFEVTECKPTVWDTKNYRLLWRLTEKDAIYGISIRGIGVNEKSTQVSYITSPQVLRVRDIRNGELIKTVTLTINGQGYSPPSYFLDFDFSSQGKWIASKKWVAVNKSLAIQIWDAQGNEIQNWQTNYQNLHILTFSPDETILAAVDDTGIISMWELRTGKLLRTFGQRNKGIRSLTFSPDSRTLAVALADKTVYLQRVK